MRHWGAWVAYLGLAGVCLMWAGCGGSDIPNPDSDPHAAKGPAPPAMSSPPPAVAETVTPAPEVTPRPASAEPAPAEAVAKTESVPAPTEILAPAPPASGGSGSEPARNVTPAASPDVDGAPAIDD